MKSMHEIAEQIMNTPGWKGGVRFDEPMSEHTTFKIGGSASVFFEPGDADSLVMLVHMLKENGLSWFILGGGSNIVVSDKGFDIPVISTSGINKIISRKMTPDKVMVTAGSGTKISDLVDYCALSSLSGFEKFAGLPGTAGGAVYMNARCFEVSVSTLIESVCYFDVNSMEVCEYYYHDYDWDYKKSPFQTNEKIVLSASFNLQQLPYEYSTHIQAVSRKYIEERRMKGHFNYPSAGSVFKNNHAFGEPSGKIIDECGLRGTRIGGAQVAPFHGNFIINTGGATQKDVKSLVELVVNKVEAEKGFTLESEIIFCGKD